VSQSWVGSDFKNHVDLLLCVAAMDLERPPVLGVLLERDLAGVRVDGSPSPDRQDDGRREFRSSTSLGPTGMLTIVSGARFPGPALSLAPPAFRRRGVATSRRQG
jgi:hypothetical protein